MATYFHVTPEIQPDGLQTLYLMNPSYVSYTDATAAAPPANTVLLNSVNPMSLVQANQLPTHHQQQQQQHFVGIPLQTSAAAADAAAPPHYNFWTQTSNNTVDVASQFSPRRPLPMAAPSQQALSLSLSPRDIPGPAVVQISPASANEVKMAVMMAPSSSVTGSGNGVASLQSFLLGSKYLKAAQHLLDEVVNVGEVIKDDVEKSASSKHPMKGSNKDTDGARTGASTEEDTSAKRGADLTTAERQELQIKKAKLVNMLDEVEHRYRQYHQQMQLVVSSFEAVAGYGSAKTYTALPLQTISKQFRCLRDAITGQIRETSKNLGEEDPKSGGSRLRFVDHHLRQQRALQQLGMIQHNAWRPQRGLPERSVSILRAWLFEHFLHPYPKDSDKLMLAKQTGLTRSQVSNWFINARVRLWKPMVEEMYAEEFKDQEQNNTEENTSKSDANGSSTPKSGGQQESSPTVAGPFDSLKNKPGQTLATLQQSTLVNGSNHADYYDHEAILHPNLKKARSNESLHGNPVPPSVNVEAKSDQVSNQDFLLKFMDRRQRVDNQGYPLIPGNSSHGGSYGAYPIGDLARFDAEPFGAPPGFSGNGVSLTLGLPHCDNLSLSAAQPSFLSNEGMQLGRRLEMSNEAGDYCSLNSNATVAHSSNVYDSIALQNRKRFAAQLLPDFVS